MRGEVVGIHSSIGPMVTHNFHVPITAFRKNWDRLLAGKVWGGRFDRDDDNKGPLLGVRGRTEDGRCLVTQVYPGMPAAKAGLKVGDVIVAVENRQIATFDELARVIFFKAAGDKVRLRIDRAGESLEMVAELTAAPD
jgi:serine protease Do